MIFASCIPEAYCFAIPVYSIDSKCIYQRTKCMSFCMTVCFKHAYNVATINDLRSAYYQRGCMKQYHTIFALRLQTNVVIFHILSTVLDLWVQIEYYACAKYNSMNFTFRATYK